MKAAVFVGPGQLELREVPTPHAGEGEIVLKTGSNTVCGTDVRIMKGEKSAGVRPGVILGHEISGYVHEIGKGVEGYAEGDLVGINPTVSCGTCFYCRTGAEHLCERAELFGYAIDGGLADYVLIPKQAVARRAHLQGSGSPHTCRGIAWGASWMRPQRGGELRAEDGRYGSHYRRGPDWVAPRDGE